MVRMLILSAGFGSPKSRQNNSTETMGWFALVLCCLMTPGLSKEIRCHV